MNSAKYYEKSLVAVAKKYNFEYTKELLMPWSLAAKHMDVLVDWMSRDISDRPTNEDPAS